VSGPFSDDQTDDRILVVLLAYSAGRRAVPGTDQNNILPMAVSMITRHLTWISQIETNLSGIWTLLKTLELFLDNRLGGSTMGVSPPILVRIEWADSQGRVTASWLAAYFSFLVAPEPSPRLQERVMPSPLRAEASREKRNHKLTLG
jgi:hypothetical protein